jgi:N-acetyl-alpha-D-muramate 1-phosphate uridylyltransferase
MMQVVVLAGGLGLRLGALTTDLPKIMVEVNGQPFIKHQLDWLENQGATEVLFSIGFKGEAVEEWVTKNASNFNCKISTFFDKPSGLGTLGSLIQIANQNLLEDTFLVTYGDTIPRISLKEVYLELISQKLDILLTGINKYLVNDHPNMLVSNGKLLEYSKNTEYTKEFTHIEYGVLGMSRKALENRTMTHGYEDLSVLINEILAKSPIPVLEAKVPYTEMGSPAGLAKMQQEFIVRNSLE